MTIEEAAELMDNAEYAPGKKNHIAAGFAILSKYCDDIAVSAEHDEIWAGPDRNFEAFVEEIKREDIEELATLGWDIDDSDSFHHFA